jgi:uncharacterized protein
VDAVNVPAGLMALYRPSVQPYIISWLKYDPRTEITKVKSRVTIVQGSHDVQVSVENGKALAAALPSATFALIDGMTHVLTTDDPATNLAGQLTGAYADAARPLSTNLRPRAHRRGGVGAGITRAASRNGIVAIALRTGS